MKKKSPTDDKEYAHFLDTVRPALPPVCGNNSAEMRIARALKWGRQNAIKVSRLSTIAAVPGREVQEIIHHLITVHEWPIGTSMGPPYGNYLIDSSSDLEKTVTLLRVRGISSLHRAAMLNGQSLDAFLRSIQRELDLDTELRRN